MSSLTPRKAVLGMAPYSPPTGNRLDKLRLDFNENTVGCSPAVIERLKSTLDAGLLTVYPDYARVKAALSKHFRVSPDELLLTNGTDEAIQVLVNTYVDDGDEVIALRPSYAMYRFYSEVAGAKIVEVDYTAPALAFPLAEVLAAITPRTRAILIANPNNPTGTAVNLTGIEQILKAAPRAAVLIDEAYYEFFGVTALSLLWKYPQLFVSRTFSKVFGMAALRMGCLFSQSANVKFLHKAQSPYSVNTLAAIAAEAAVEDTAYIENYVTEALAAREMLEVGLEKLGIEHVPGSANFVLGYFGDRAVEIRDALRERAILVRDRSYEIPGGVRITVGTREQTRRVLSELGENLVKDLIVFDMDGVLVDVSESYRAAIQATVLHFTGTEPTNDEVQVWKNRGGFNDDWKLSHRMIQELGEEVPYDDVVNRFQQLFLGNNNNGLILKERWLAAEGLFDRLAANHTLAIFTGRLGWEAQITLDRFAKTTFHPIVGVDHVSQAKPHPEGLHKIRAAVSHRKVWYLGDTVDDARAASAAGVPFIGIACPSAPRHAELVQLLRDEGAVAVIDDINSLEGILAAHS